MISFPLQLAALYFMIGMVVSWYAMTDEKIERQHEYMLEMEEVPEELKPSIRTFLSIMYIVLWPYTIYTMSKGS